MIFSRLLSAPSLGCIHDKYACAHHARGICNNTYWNRALFAVSTSVVIFICCHYTEREIRCGLVNPMGPSAEKTD